MTIAELSVGGLILHYKKAFIVTEKVDEFKDEVVAHYFYKHLEGWMHDNPKRDWLRRWRHIVLGLQAGCSILLVTYSHLFLATVTYRLLFALFIIILFTLSFFVIGLFTDVSDPNNMWKRYEQKFVNQNYPGGFPESFFQDCNNLGFCVDVDVHAPSGVCILSVVNPNDYNECRYYIDVWREDSPEKSWSLSGRFPGYK